ncbi:MAG: alpha/beta fold hydrolase [Hyphomicrobiales bacterium]|nr:alpha/beta fold hydrolase [Hyphomicrobiales bacterium]
MKARKLVKFIVISVLITVTIYFAIALGLLLSQSPTELGNMPTISFEATTSSALDDEVVLTNYTARDGAQIGFRHFGATADDAPLVVLIHGSGWHGGSYTKIAEFLSANGDFEVLLPDLRGHGPNAAMRGDVAYIGQLEDDLADLIEAHLGDGQKLYVIGHSSGGGLAIRFAGGQYGQKLDKVVLMSPFLKYNAPTMRLNAGGWSIPLTRRIIGLTMLNSVGITLFNDMTVIQFNFPLAVLNGNQGYTATQSYSYRLNTSFAPRDDYLADIAKLPEFLLLVGANDDAFIADEFEPIMATATSTGQYKILPNVDHLGLINNPEANVLMLEFLQD